MLRFIYTELPVSLQLRAHTEKLAPWVFRALIAFDLAMLLLDIEMSHCFGSSGGLRCDINTRFLRITLKTLQQLAGTAGSLNLGLREVKCERNVNLGLIVESLAGLSTDITAAIPSAM